MTLPVNDAVPGAVRQLQQSLRAKGLASAVAAYFSPEEDFAGLSFTCLGSNPRDVVTTSDLLAVSLLDIAWRPEAVRQLLDTSTAMVSGLLSAIRSGGSAMGCAAADARCRHRYRVQAAGAQAAEAMPGQRQGCHPGRRRARLDLGSAAHVHAGSRCPRGGRGAAAAVSRRGQLAADP